MQNNFVYQNIVRTFASLKQEGRLVVDEHTTVFVRHTPNYIQQNFQPLAAPRSWIFCLYMVRLFLFSTRSVSDAIIHLQSELKSSQGGGTYTIGCK